MRDRRRQKLVGRFQYKMIARIFLYWVIYQVTLFNFLFCWNLLEVGRGNLMSQYLQFMQNSYPMLICFVILVPAFAWDSVKFYHRIAGPIVRFRATARDIAAEQPVRRVKLREGDELTELADDFNSMLDTLVRLGGAKLIENGVDTETNGQVEETVAEDSREEELTNAAN